MTGSGGGRLVTARLELAPLTGQLMAALREGDWDAAADLTGAALPDEWPQQEWSWLAHHLQGVADDPAASAWGPRVLRLRSEGTIVGETGFHGPPDADGEAEIGYMVAGAHRRRGYARESVTGLLSWALQQVMSVRALTDPDNTASMNLLLAVGFNDDGHHQHPERGDQHRFRWTPPEVTG